MTKRILHIIPSLDRAGAEKQLALLAPALPRDLFEVHVCALTRAGPLAAELHAAGVPFTVIGKRWKADPFTLWRLQRHVARLKPDLIHSWLFAANAYGRLAGLASGVKHLVAGERCADQWKVGYQFVIDRWLARRTDRITCNSLGVREFCAEHGLPTEKLEVIPNGVPPARPGEVSREELLAELGLPAEARLIGAVGRLWQQKRVKDLIWAADLVHLLHPDARLVVIGDGPQRRMLERFTALLRAENHVRLLGHREDVPRILPHLDALWLGSEYEGMSNALMEAMAAAVPVVATDIPGNRELVVPDETGFLAPVGGRAAFARATDLILRDAELARRLGDAGRRRMLEHFGVQQMIDAHVKMYREILNV